MLEKFNADVTIARRKSQRMSGGSGEALTAMQEELLRFDREKQSTNDANALRRQYPDTCVTTCRKHSRFNCRTLDVGQ